MISKSQAECESEAGCCLSVLHSIVTQAVRQQAAMPCHTIIAKPQQITASSSNSTIKDSQEHVQMINKKTILLIRGLEE